MTFVSNASVPGPGQKASEARCATGPHAGSVGNDSAQVARQAEGVMGMESLRGYVQLATGLTEVTLAKARETARQLLEQGLDLGAAQSEAKSAATKLTDQVSGLADDLMEQGKANREALVGLVRTEVDKAVGRLGFVREEELAALRAHVMRLEAQLAKNAGATSAATRSAKSPAAKKSSTANAARKSTAKKKAAQ